MPSKKLAKGSGIDSAIYSMDRRVLTFTYNDGAILSFAGVPAEVYYGMPSGALLTSFIQIKLQGRYLCAFEPACPLVTVSRMNLELTVTMQGKEMKYPITKEEVSACPDTTREAFTWFVKTIGDRKPSYIDGVRQLPDTTFAPATLPALPEPQSERRVRKVKAVG